MRRAIKIKAYTILLAWGMIFAHSIIPHNHIDECLSSGCESNHLLSSDNNASGQTLKFVLHPENANICHISGFIFHQFNQDNLFSDYCGNINVSPLCLTISYSINSSDSFFTELLNRSASFRAPPSA